MRRRLATLVFAIVAVQTAVLGANVAVAAAATAAVLSHEIVPATAAAMRNGEASFIPLKDGSLLLLYGAHAKSGDWDRGEIRQIRSRDGGTTWSQPETVFSDPKRSLFQCALARLPSGDLGLTHTSLAHGQDAIKVFRRSSDEGKTWSEPIVISDKEYAYTTGPWDKLYVLESGRVLALLHCNLKPDATKQGGPLGSYAVSSDDDGKTWKRSPAAEVLHVADNPHKGNGRGNEWGFWEPSLVEHAPGKLLMLGRTTTGWLWESRSADNGTTWSAPVKTTVPNPVAPPVLTRVPGTDTLVLIQNPDVDMQSGWHGGPRRALAFRTSTDGGHTWSEPTDLYRATEEGLWVDYPAIRWIDGNLHMVWRHVRDPATPRNMTGLFHLAVPAALLALTSAKGATLEADVCVYGATSGGVAASVQAARMGKRVVLIEPGRHLGGMTSGGLSAVDIGDPRTVGGITREFFTRLVARYGKTLAWDEPHKAVGGSGGGTGGAFCVEPHVAEEVFNDLVKEAGVPVLREARLVEVAKEGPRINRIVVAGADGTRREIAARMFIDTTYEGDLMAAAGVSHTLTREGRDQYGEPLAGIRYAEWCRPRTPHEQPGPNGRKPSGQGVWDRDFPLDPYLRKGDPASGLLPLINPGEPGTPGEAAPGVQAYCFRLCLTTAADRLPIESPPGYDPARYEIVARFIEACLANGDDMDLRWFSKHDPVPNDKYDFNTATFGANLPGASWGWCEASHARRQELKREQEHYQRGLLHFLATDPRVPAKVRADMRRFGLPSDEFRDTGGWPHQLYVREGRRMIGDLVMTQDHVCGKRVVDDPVSLGSYGIDAHEIRRIVKDGVVTREGKLAEGRDGAGPYRISYRAIVPQQAECDNLLVTFALSASHVAFSSIRMEPVFMVSSQTAATAAAMAIDDGVPVQEVDYAKLKGRLVDDGQILGVPAPPLKAPKNAAKPEDVSGKPYDLVVIGGTPGGIACAVRAAREGLRVLLVNHTRHLGGFITSGAGGWEATYDGHRSPLYGEVLAGAAAYYRDRYGEGSPQHILSMPSRASRAHIDRAKVEPRVAELLFNRMVEREQSLTVLLGHIVMKAERNGSLLKSVTLRPMHGEGVVTVSGTVFTDAMYEGDLIAAAGVKTQIGRESRAHYGEKHAGVVYTKEHHKELGQRGFPKVADNGTLNIRYLGHSTGEIVAGPHSGEADGSVMAYNYRLILTRDPVNRIMVEKPANYDPSLAKGPAGLSIVPNLPNGKVAWNGGRLIGPQNEYPGAGWPIRDAIAKRYLDAMLMRLWWLQNDPQAPAGEREAFAGYGLAADEFSDNHHVPYEIYVREARRLVGRYVFKEHDNVVAEGVARTPIHTDSIATTDWPMDSHDCTRDRSPGYEFDGKLILTEESRPAQIPWGSLLPKGVDNLIVPVGLSATHVAWGAVRLEPVWMMTGEAAGVATALSKKQRTSPGKLDPDLLLAAMVTNWQFVTFFNDLQAAAGHPAMPAAQYFGTKGFFADYDARLDAPQKAATQAVWEQRFAALRSGALDPADLVKQVHRAESENSPPTGRTRGAALLAMWESLSNGTQVP